MRRLLLALLLALALPGSAVTVDRIAAVIDHEVLTVSEVTQLVEIRFFPRTSESEDDHRRDVLDALIAQALVTRAPILTADRILGRYDVAVLDARN